MIGLNYLNSAVHLNPKGILKYSKNRCTLVQKNPKEWLIRTNKGLKNCTLHKCFGGIIS